MAYIRVEPEHHLKILLWIIRIYSVPTDSITNNETQNYRFLSIILP